MRRMQFDGKPDAAPCELSPEDKETWRLGEAVLGRAQNLSTLQGQGKPVDSYVFEAMQQLAEENQATYCRVDDFGLGLVGYINKIIVRHPDLATTEIPFPLHSMMPDGLLHMLQRERPRVQARVMVDIYTTTGISGIRILTSMGLLRRIEAAREQEQRNG